MDELAFTSTRISADAYAEEALTALQDIIGQPSARRRGYIRDELAEAFTAGEHQGECRAILILSIARARATDMATRAALTMCLQLLCPIDEGVV